MFELIVDMTDWNRNISIPFEEDIEMDDRSNENLRSIDPISSKRENREEYPEEEDDGSLPESIEEITDNRWEWTFS